MNPPLIRGLREQILHRLRTDVLTGRLAAGDHLREADLARMFRVSRSPIREALVQLTQEGLLVAEANRGVRVAPQPPDRVIRSVIVPIRQIIESFALESVFEELTEEDLSQFDAILKRMHKACQNGDTAALAEEDIAFHRLLLERANQPDLLLIWSAILNRIHNHFRVDLDAAKTTEDLLRIYDQHVEIVAALRERNLPAALDRLQNNIN